MSKFYLYSKQYGNQILFRGYENGRRVIEKIKYQPTLFVEPSDKKFTSDWYSLYDNKPLEPIKFDSINGAKEFIKTYEGVSGFNIHGFQKFEYQYICDNYKGVVDYNINDVDILTFDIETVDSETDDNSFPDIQLAEVPIVLISMISSKDNKTIVLGIKDYVKQPDDNFEFMKFASEKEMLYYFIHYNEVNKPDIWSGWNTSEFDIPYLVNRCMKLFDKSVVNRLSPFGIIREKITELMGKEVQTYEIFGIVDLDYLKLYKNYGGTAGKVSYALGAIAEEELGITKHELKGNSFTDNYNNYYQDFVKYSAIDSQLVSKIDAKVNLIALAFEMTYIYKSNISDIYKTAVPWEALIYNFLDSKKIAVPPRNSGERMPFEGAWVKEPIPQLYGWVMSFDFSALYNSIMQQWNISPNTFIPAHDSFLYSDFLADSETCKTAIKYCKNNNLVLGGNGSMFTKEFQGFIPEILETLKKGRDADKSCMLEYEKEYEVTKDESLVSKISSFNNKQLAKKLLGNEIYGVLGAEGFHYFDYRIAECITYIGQISNRYTSAAINDKMNSIMKTQDVDYNIYSDTDSAYINCQSLVDKFMVGKSKDDIIKFLDKFAKDIIQPVINKSVQDIFDKMNCFKKVMGSKREAIASKALFRGKKNYALYVHNSEGVSYNPPKLKTVGIEIVRSSTPKWCRSKLKESLMMIFEKSESEFKANFEKVESEFHKLRPDEIAFPRGVNDIDKWLEGSSIKSRCPIHVRAAITYNKAVKSMKQYQQLTSGDKIKYVYMKLPNKLHQDVLGFPSNMQIPADLNIVKYVDYNKQFEKSFENPLRSLTDVAGWKLRDEASLEDLFN